jgi:hypothetical protein
MGVAGVGFAPENLADEKREDAVVRGHGTVQNLAGQAVAKLASRDHAFRVGAGMGAPRDEGSVLLPRGAMIFQLFGSAIESCCCFCNHNSAGL